MCHAQLFRGSIGASSLELTLYKEKDSYRVLHRLIHTSMHVVVLTLMHNSTHLVTQDNT